MVQGGQCRDRLIGGSTRFSTTSVDTSRFVEKRRRDLLIVWMTRVDKISSAPLRRARGRKGGPAGRTSIGRSCPHRPAHRPPDDFHYLFGIHLGVAGLDGCRQAARDVVFHQEQ